MSEIASNWKLGGNYWYNKKQLKQYKLNWNLSNPKLKTLIFRV